MSTSGAPSNVAAKMRKPGGQIVHPRVSRNFVASPSGIAARPCLHSHVPAKVPTSPPPPVNRRSSCPPSASGLVASATSAVFTTRGGNEGRECEKTIENVTLVHRSGGSITVSPGGESMKVPPPSVLVRTLSCASLQTEDISPWTRKLGTSLSVPVIQAVPAKAETPSPKSLPDVEQLKPDLLKLWQDQIVSLRAETQSLSSKIDTLAQDLLASRTELRNLSVQLSSDVEARLTKQITGLERQLQAETRLQSSSKTSESIDWNLVGSVVGAGSGGFSVKANSTSPEDEPSEITKLVNEISDRVIERVNADPRICALVDSHQSIQESFAKLLDMLDKQDDTKERRDVLALCDTVFETQKKCKSMVVEIRQIRQKRNQDCSENAMRFENLERKLQAIGGVDQLAQAASDLERKLQAIWSASKEQDNNLEHEDTLQEVSTFGSVT